MFVQEYQPIDCSFHDVLLDRITRKKVVDIVYSSPDGKHQTSKHIRLLDVYTRQKQEFLVMADELTIRLDQIVSVDGLVRPNNFSCEI